MRRRDLLVGFGAVALAGPVRAAASDDALARFDGLLAHVGDDPASLEAARAEREGQAEEFDFYVSRAVAPRPHPSDRPIDERATTMIIKFEVSGAAAYDRLYRHPVWPKGDSGITIGVGYDLGYVTKEFLREDWSGHLPDATIAALAPACGLKAAKAGAVLTRFRGIDVPWPAADAMFRQRLLKLYVAETLNRLPNADKLSDRSLGAMVSLVYNRGGAFDSRKPSRLEMLQIYRLMRDEDYAPVPDRIRAMKRIWAGKPALRGLLARRDLEADLFQAGLAA